MRENNKDDGSENETGGKYRSCKLRGEKLRDKQGKNEGETLIHMEIRRNSFYHPILSSSKIHV